MANRKYKEHIDDYESMEEIKDFSLDDLKHIKGTENLILTFQPLQDAMRKMSTVATSMQAFQEKAKNIPKIADEYNWHITPSIDLKTLQQILASYDNKDEIDKLFMQYYTNNMEKLQDKLCNDFSDRAKIINEAYNAHLNHNYYSSIVLFFTQIDGLSKFLTGETFFMSREWKRNSIDDDIKSMLAYYFLKIYFEDSVLMKQSAKQRENWEIGHINRHQVLHGEVVNFDTEMNSLKVFALLIALVENLQWIKGRG